MTHPYTLWATDATEGWIGEGRCAVFAIVDHASGEAWVDAAPRMDRFAAADLLREACAERFGSVEHAVAAGLALRYDGGRTFARPTTRPRSTTSASPAAWPTTTSPRPDGVVEKFIQTLKEQVLWIERFETLEDLRAGRARVRLHLQPRVG